MWHHLRPGSVRGFLPPDVPLRLLPADTPSRATCPGDRFAGPLHHLLPVQQQELRQSRRCHHHRGDCRCWFGRLAQLPARIHPGRNQTSESPRFRAHVVVAGDVAAAVCRGSGHGVCGEVGGETSDSEVLLCLLRAGQSGCSAPQRDGRVQVHYLHVSRTDHGLLCAAAVHQARFWSAWLLS